MKKNAFSLVEISIVIVVISILIAGIMEGRILVKKAKVSEAKTQTINSPVANIGGLLLWYETTLEESLIVSEAKDGNSVSTWYDLNPNVETVKNNATQNTATNRPIYKTNRINGLPAISFTRTASNYLSFDGTGIANSAFTIFIVEQRTSNDSPNPFLGGTSSTTNSNLSFAYQNESIVIDQNNNVLSKTIFPTYSVPTPRIHSFTFNFSTKNYFVNGLEMSLTGTGITNPLAAFIGASLGANRKAGSENYFQGDIGEVIIFKKALSTDDRKEVEKYLGKKWSIKTYSETSGSCNGIIDGSGCLTSCLVNITGITSPSSVVGPSSGTFFCKTPEYNDSIPYTCSIAGILDIGGQSCDVCAAGYNYYGGVCQGSCSISGIAGIINGTTIAAGPNTATCNDTANNFTGTVAGVCSGGTFTPDSGQTCGCASGYTLSAGTCILVPCTVSITGVLSPSSVAGGSSGTFTCKTPEYNDTIPYTCLSGGVLDIGGQACDVCSSGYSYYNSTCQGPCSISGINGIVNGTSIQAGSGSVSCNNTANHYSGSISGVCNAGVFTPNSGQTCGCASGYELNGSGICTPSCTGGDNIYTITVGTTSYKVHEFTTVTADPINNPNNFSCGISKTVEVLVVGGGGGGGGGAFSTGGSGGGAGRVIYNNSVSVSAGSVNVIVGDGGSGGNAVRGCTGGGSNGSLSKFGTISASGGGGGGGRECNGRSGGSGGGAGTAGWQLYGGSGGTGGYAGGNNIAASYNTSIGFGAGGGGGSSLAGGNGANNKGGKGGSGSTYNITGTSKQYGGGGAASLKCLLADCSSYYGVPGTGGGGSVNSAGDPNTGGGGGGGANETSPGGKGGSGIVIIRYQYP